MNTLFRSASLVKACPGTLRIYAGQSRCLSVKSDPLANIGDYPTSIPMINRQSRPLTEKWDNQQDRRNFSEPVCLVVDTLII